MEKNGVTTIKRLKPTQSFVPLDNLYLNQGLHRIAQKLDSPIVYTSYVTDKNEVIAIKDNPGTPEQLKNTYDWKLFQELLAQADTIITGSRYFNKVQDMGAEAAQNVITQFNKDAEFAEFGEWRRSNGFPGRNPDIAVVSRSLGFRIPENINPDRKITVFTTHTMYESEEANKLKEQGAEIVAGGVKGVDGRIMIDHLHRELGYETIMMATGPSVLKILLDANVLDRLYITQVQREIHANEDKKITVLKDKKVKELKNFELTHEFLQETAEMDDGQSADQYFRIYDHKKFLLKLQ